LGEWEGASDNEHLAFVDNVAGEGVVRVLAGVIAFFGVELDPGEVS
jgi:hypothetical protein